jgi:hypothetical protein
LYNKSIEEKKMTPNILGIDFTSRPTRHKPVTIALCQFDESAATLILRKIVRAVDFVEMQNFLIKATPWLGAFDFPFGLPREFIQEQGWLGGLKESPKGSFNNWRHITNIVISQTRAELVVRCKAYCDARPAGEKFAHRAVDHLAGSSPSMKWVNPPVLFMLHAGLPILLALDCTLPSLDENNKNIHRVALEGYPGFTARQITRQSYKSDDRAKQTIEREAARQAILAQLCDRHGHAPLGVRLKASRSLRAAMIADASGDSLDAAICALQAAYAYIRRDARYGYPTNVDPLEGWIAGI